MLLSTDTALSAPPASLDNASESAMNALYRAALGPIGASYYLPLFARFDAAERTFTGWNWAASLCIAKIARGQRIRVRVGPISTEQEARAASHRIGRLGLDAVIFKQ